MSFKVALQWKQEVVNIIHTLCNYLFFFHSTFSYRVLMNGIQSPSYLLSFYHRYNNGQGLATDEILKYIRVSG